MTAGGSSNDGSSQYYIKSLYSKYQKVDDRIISEYISSIPEGLSDAVKMINEQLIPVKGDDVLSNRKKLIKYISTFHNRAGTDFSMISRAVENLLDPSTQILISIHQPNLFPYSGVFKKIVLLQTIKSILERHHGDSSFKFINLFLVVDHDFMDDVWIRVAQLPSIRHSNGILELRIPIKERDRWKLVRNMEVPPRAVVEMWRDQVVSWIKNGSSSLGFDKNERLTLFENFGEFWREVDASYDRSISYADLNSFIMSRLVNKIWGYDTLFVRLSEISQVFENGLNFLFKNSRKYSEILSESDRMFRQSGVNTRVSPNTYLNAPVWLHCRCGSKASVKFNQVGDGDLELAGDCISCKKGLSVKLDKSCSQGIPNNILNQLSPR
ncbi:MAG TPA: hypothetical protein VE130_11820, partial [Nitrososphaeraceae archaeon]|nr:hypothetical protein [Nitrososphaeraceae archaeon]